ncbi:MAG TPA: hypothetical protein VG821_06250 [Rhizomicrobium sp.]|nr:hypothetical protein [Rhizomicrobium sp.]
MYAEGSAKAQSIESFAREWVLSNVTNVPGLADLVREVDRLASRMTADARLAGISGGELARALGDIDEYLTLEYEKKPAALAAGFT